jgi:hypothetical protein
MTTSSSRRQTSKGGLSPEIKAKVDSIQREFGRLESQAQLTAAYETVGRIRERINEFPAQLEELQRRGLLHSRPLHERLQLVQGEWRKVAPQVQNALREQKNRLKADVNSTSRLVSRARSGQQAAISSADSAVDRLQRKIRESDRVLSSLYGNVDSELDGIESELAKIEWMMKSLEESPEIQLKQGEGPLKAVKAVWHRDGDEGPEGVLYLTDQRLLFEQKEEVVTKKRFGIFKADSEMVHKLWLDINVSDITSMEDSEEGGFLGMGKADILEMTCTGQAPFSRSRFHLKGQDSSDWRSWIKQVQSGEVDSERHQQAAEAAAEAELTFPTQCPNCLASLPEARRGATRVTCEFCGSAVGPIQA